MAFATKSTQFTAMFGGSGVPKRDASEINGALQAQRIDYTHAAGADTGTIELGFLPPGDVQVLVDLCRVVTSQFAAGAVLDLGHRAYVAPDGTAVAADGAAFANDLAAGAGALDQTWPLPASGAKSFSSREGVAIFATVASGNMNNGNTISGYVTWIGTR